MAYYDAKGLLTDNIGDDDTQQVLFPIPTDGRDYVLVYRLDGTFVGTVEAQDDQGGSFAGVDTVELLATGTVAAGDPTAVGNYAAAVTSGAGYARLVATAFTSGEIEVEGVLVPVSA